MNYFDEIINCPACDKSWVRREWPNVPSTGKPKKTCCQKKGDNRRAVFNARKVEVDGEIHYKCNKCEKIKPPKDFYFNKGRPNNYCKKCKKEVIENSPSQIKRRHIVAINRKNKNNETKKCNKCGLIKKKSEWPRSLSGDLAVTCCSQEQRRRRDELIRSGYSTCTSCKKTKNINQFYLKKGRPHSWCKNCQKAHATSSGSRKKRQELIDKTCDGTLDKKTVGNLFGSFRNCPCCGVNMKRNDKHLDHIIPLSKGGKHSVSNAMILCSDCNLKKSNKDLSDWLKNIPDENINRLILNIEANKNLYHVLEEIKKWRQQVA